MRVLVTAATKYGATTEASTATIETMIAANATTRAINTYAGSRSLPRSSLSRPPRGRRGRWGSGRAGYRAG
jgi:hypothetical protein